MRRTACYFPIVPNREGEITAVGHLSPRARARSRIIYEVDRPTDADAADLGNHIIEAVRKISRAWGSGFSLLVDLPTYGPEHRTTNGSHIVEYAFMCLRQLGALAVPVAGPISARGPEMLEIIRDVALRDKRGAALRVPFAEFNNTDVLQRELSAAMRILALNPAEVYLLFDLEAVHHIPASQRSAAYLTAVIHEALAVTRMSGEFRNVVLCGSSVPESVGKEYDSAPYRGRRIEFDVWRSLLTDTNIPVSFSDGGITALRGDDPRGHGRALARVRLSTPDEHVLHRAERKKYVDLCKRVVSSADFNRTIVAWGATKLRECAREYTQASSPTIWVARDTNLHFETTLVEIEQRLRLAGRITDYQFPEEETSAWLQHSILENVEV